MYKSFFAPALLALSAGSAQAAVINEFRPNPPGGDPSTQTIEFKGNAGESFSGYFLSIETDAGGGLGLVDRYNSISGTFDGNGLLAVDVPDLENPSFLSILTDSFSGNNSTDLDTDNDGALDNLAAIGSVFDAIGVYDNNGDNLGWGSALGGSDLAYIGDEPELVFRDSATNAIYAVDSAGDVYDSAAVQMALDSFDLDPATPTFAAVNPTAVPLPTAAWFFLSALGGLFGLNRRRRA